MTTIKLTDYIIEFLISKGCDTLFGYPGGVICHFMDSASKYKKKICLNVNYHEQASAFAACSYAQAKHTIGVAFATSGPGATNLLTGIANAWFDSIPVMFFTGQVDTYATKDTLNIRQRGFQETDIVSITTPITKYSTRINNAEDIEYELQKAYFMATSGRKGPVLIDLPADIQRAIVKKNSLKKFKIPKLTSNYNIRTIVKLINNARRPIILAGAGINQANARQELKLLAETLNIPVVTSMPAYDLLPYNHYLQNGFIGVNGHRYGNLLFAKADLVICLGSRLDIKQIGLNRKLFNPKTKLIRVDIDTSELNYAVSKDEVLIQDDVKKFLGKLISQKFSFTHRDSTWCKFAQNIKNKLQFVNDTESAHHFIRKISKILPQKTNYTLDVGQNEVWAVQSLELKENQRIYMSAGLGTMGYALPAAIGVYYATQKPVVALVGDGGFQMNIQELQFIAKNKLPITILIFNNESLGMIRQFQERNFNANYVSTTFKSGYSNPDFEKIAKAYNFKYKFVEKIKQINKKLLELDTNKIIEIKISNRTHLLPYFGKEVLFDQEPKIDRKIYNEIEIY